MNNKIYCVDSIDDAYAIIRDHQGYDAKLRSKQ